MAYTELKYVESKLLTLILTGILVWGIGLSGAAIAALSLTSVYPSQGEIGRELEVKLTGSGFTSDMNVLIYPEIGTNRSILGSVYTLEQSRQTAIKGMLAYVAAGENGIRILDITNAAHPEVIATMPIPGYAYNITVVGNTAYVASGDDGIHILDVSNPLTPKIVGAADIAGSAREITVVGDIAYIAGDQTGLVMMPVSTEIEKTIFLNESTVIAKIPAPLVAGHYSLKVTNGDQTSELAGAITFKDMTDFSRAIIVCGGGPSSGDWLNSLWEDTKLCADYAYRSLLYQGYSKENIYYISEEDRDPDGNGYYDDIDNTAANDSLSYAINHWANSDAINDVILYMVDHGGDGTFRMNAGETLAALDLDEWLDDLQSVINGKLIVIYDACQAGTFLDKLTPPPDKRRIILTSTADEIARFLNGGALSFSYQFWSRVYYGSTLEEAFNFAYDMMKTFQTALIDANGNAIPNEPEDNVIIGDIVIGRKYVPASDIPVIRSISSPMTLTGSPRAEITARDIVDADGIKNVWATIQAPCSDPVILNQPVENLPTIELSDNDHDGVYQGSYTGFDTIGKYRITVYAEDEMGVYSLPKQTTITQTDGISCLPGDIDNSGIVDMKDLIGALKILANIETEIIAPPNDLDNDGKVGPPETIYLLRVLGEILE